MTKLAATLIYNPKAGRRQHARTLGSICDLLGSAYDLTVQPSEAAGMSIELAKDSADRGDAVAFAWGGDGTIREVCEGLYGSETALGPLPGGTANVVPRGVGLSANAIEAARRLRSCRVFERHAGLLGSQPFLMQATAGLDGYMMRETRGSMKARFGFAGLVYEALRLLPRYPFAEFDVTVDGHRHRVTGAGFANLPWYAGPFRYATEANWRDGHGRVLLYRGRTLLTGVSFALALMTGQHEKRPYVTVLRAAELSFPPLRDHDGVSTRAAIQFDGDPWDGPLPVICRVAPKKIRVLLPHETS